MNPRLLLTILGGMSLLVSGCHKKASEAASSPPAAVELVAPSERSRHFLAVNRQLELGGTVYGYMDVDGDMLKLAGGLSTIADHIATANPAAAPYLKQDYAQLFSTLGFDDIKALGVSSVPDANGGFRNRVFIYTPDGRHGLLAGLGGPPAPFANAKLAPPDADLYIEAEFDAPAAYSAVKSVIAKAAGQKQADTFEAELKQRSAGLSSYDLIQGLKGRSTLILRIDPERNVTWPGAAPFTAPAFSLLLRIEGVGQAVEPALAQLPLLEKSDAGALHIYSSKMPLPLPDLQPVLAVEGSTFYLATSAGFLTECSQRKAGLDTNAAFQQALAKVGSEGNGLTYISPRFFQRLRQLGQLNPSLPENEKRVLALVMDEIPAVTQPLVAVRINQADGILVRAQWNRSIKRDLAVMAAYNPVAVGLLAAMAIPAFEKVRASSQEKAIVNNLRQIAAASQQYMLETGKAEASYHDIVGPEPEKYIRSITPVAGEDYTRIVVHMNDTEISVTTADGRVIRYQL